MSQNTMLWVDLETTGTQREIHLVRGVEKLGCQHHDILEIAAVLTDMDLNVIDQRHHILHADETSFAKMDDYVTKMHTGSGLLDACRESDMTVEMAEHSILSMLFKNDIKEKTVYVAGNTVHFDVMFMAAQMPALTSHTHYRIIDVSSFKTILSHQNSGITDEVAAMKQGGHRALDDILESIEELKLYKTKFV